VFPLSSEDFGSVLRDFCQNPVEFFKNRNKSFPQWHWCEWNFTDKIPKTRSLGKITAADDEGV